MKNVIITILIISLFFIEGCTGIGYSIGRGIQIKKSLEIEKIETIEENSWLTITLKNNEVIKGQFISCVDDTLLVTFKTTTNLNAPISYDQFLSISYNKASYKIPVDQITDIKIRKVDFRVLGVIGGAIIDLFMLVIILSGGPSVPGNFSF